MLRLPMAFFDSQPTGEGGSPTAGQEAFCGRAQRGGFQGARPRLHLTRNSHPAPAPQRPPHQPLHQGYRGARHANEHGARGAAPGLPPECCKPAPPACAPPAPRLCLTCCPANPSLQPLLNTASPLPPTPQAVNSALGCLVGVALSVVSVAVVSPYILIIMLPLSLLYYRVQRLYIRTSRELKRLDAVGVCGAAAAPPPPLGHEAGAAPPGCPASPGRHPPRHAPLTPPPNPPHPNPRSRSAPYSSTTARASRGCPRSARSAASASSRTATRWAAVERAEGGAGAGWPQAFAGLEGRSCARRRAALLLTAPAPAPPVPTPSTGQHRREQPRVVADPGAQPLAVHPAGGHRRVAGLLHGCPRGRHHPAQRGPRR
jgi:hypothetical protein